MIYIAGVDGGNSKTHCLIGDANGNVISEGFAGGSNHQGIGLDAAKEIIKAALEDAASKAKIKIDEIAYTVLGLAGADFEEDYVALGEICSELLQEGRYKVLNDSWIGMKAGIDANWGIVTVCGAAGACSGRSRDGGEVRLRNMTYEVGMRGGGSDITRTALHYAFRSNEGTGCKTLLEEALPKVFGMDSIDDIILNAIMIESDTDAIKKIPVLVGELASKGDAVCQDIFISLGHELGEIAGGVVKRLGMQDETFDATLVGGVFKSECPLLIDEYTTTLHRVAPKASVSVAEKAPVFGAYYLALEEYKR